VPKKMYNALHWLFNMNSSVTKTPFMYVMFHFLGLQRNLTLKEPRKIKKGKS
jgi:hypothetical protein